MKEIKPKSSNKFNLIKITKKVYSQNKSLLYLKKRKPKKINLSILKKALDFIKNNSNKHQAYNAIHLVLIKKSVKSLRYLLPTTSLFFSAVSLLYVKKPIIFRKLCYELKKRLCQLKIINKKIKLLNGLKTKRYLVLKLYSYLLISEKFIIQRISTFKTAFFSILKNLQLVHTRNIQMNYCKINTSVLKKHKTALWMYQTPFRKWSMLSFSNHYSNKLLKALCLKVYLKFSKINEISKKSRAIQNAVSEITFSKVIFDKKLLHKKFIKSKKNARFIKWRWLNAKRNNSKKLRIHFVKTKKLILKSNRTNKSRKLYRTYGKLLRNLNISKSRFMLLKFRWKRSFKSRLFVTKYKNTRFTPQVILNYFAANKTLIQSKNKSFFSKHSHKNFMPFKFLIKALKNSYNKTFMNTISKKRAFREIKIKNIHKTIESLKEINNQLYERLSNPLPGKKSHFIYLMLYQNNRRLWLKKQLLNTLYNIKGRKTADFQKQGKSRITFPLNNNFKKLNKLNEIKNVMATKKMPYYKRLKIARKIMNLTKFSSEFYNHSISELNPDVYTLTNKSFFKQNTLSILNNFAKLYKRKLFKNFGKFNGVTRREFRLNIKNLFSQYFLIDLLVKKSFYNLTRTDFNATKEDLNIDKMQPKKILANILQLFGTMAKNNYTRKNSLLFNQLSRTNFRNSTVVKNLRRRNKSIFHTGLKIKRKNQNKFRLKNIIIRKFTKLRKIRITRQNRFFKSKSKRTVIKKHTKFNMRLSSKKRLIKEMKRVYFKTIKPLVFAISNMIQLRTLSTKQKAILKVSLLNNIKGAISTKYYGFKCLKLLTKLDKNKRIYMKNNAAKLLLGSFKVFPFFKKTKTSNLNFDLSKSKFRYSKWKNKVYLSFKRKNTWVKQYRYKLVSNWKILFSKRKQKIKKMDKIGNVAKLPIHKFKIKLGYTLWNKNLTQISPQSFVEIGRMSKPLKQRLLINLLSHKKISTFLMQALRKEQLKTKYKFVQRRLFLIENCVNLETLTLKYLTLIKKYIQLKNKIFLRRYINSSKKDLLRFKKICTIPWQQLITVKSLNENILLSRNRKKYIYNNLTKLQKNIDTSKIDTFVFNLTGSKEAIKKLNINIQINDKTLFGINFSPLTKILIVFFNKNTSLDLNKHNIKPSIYKINVKEIKRITFTFKSKSSFLDNILIKKANKKALFYFPSKSAFNLHYVLDPIRIFPRDIWIKSNTNFWFSNFKDKFVLKQFEQSKGLKNISFEYSQLSSTKGTSIKTKKNIISDYWNNPIINFKNNNSDLWKQNIFKSNLSQSPAVTLMYKANLGIKSNLNNKFGWVYDRIFLYNKNKLAKLKIVNTKIKKSRFKKFHNFAKRKNVISHALFFNAKDYHKSDLLANKSYKEYINQSYVKKPIKIKVLKETMKLQKTYNDKNAFLYKNRKSRGRSRVRKLHYKSKIFKLLRLPFRWKKKKQLKLKLIRNIKSKKTKFSFFKRLNKIQINIKNIEKNNYIWQTLYFWRILIEFLNFLPASLNKFMQSLSSEFGANLFPITRLNTIKINTKNVYFKTNEKEDRGAYNLSKLMIKLLYKKTLVRKVATFKMPCPQQRVVTNIQIPMRKRFFNTFLDAVRSEPSKFQNKKMIKYIANTELKEIKFKYICEKYDNDLSIMRQQINSKESKFPKLFYWRILAPKFNMLQQKKQRIAKLKYFNSKLKKFRWKKKKKKSLSLFFKFLGTWKRLYLFFKGKKKMEKFLPFIEGDIKIKSLKKFYSMRFIIRRYLRINFFGNVKKNKTVKIYDSVKRLQTNRFLKYCSKLRRYLIPALISMQLAQNAKMALNLVKHGYVFVNGHKITKINFIIKPLDLIMLFIPHSSHPYYLQNHHYFAKNLNSNIARVNTMQRPTNFVNGAIFPSRFFLINLKLEDWFKFMHFWTAFNSIKTSFYNLSRFENTNRLFRWKKGFYMKPAFLKKGRKTTRKALYPRFLKKRSHIALTEKLWFLKKSAINRFWNRLLKRLVFFSNCYIIFGFYFEDFNLTNKKNLKKIHRNNLTHLTMHILKQYR